MSDNTGEIQSQQKRMEIISKQIYEFNPKDVVETPKFIQIPTDKSFKDYSRIQPIVDQVQGEIHQSQLTGVVWIYLKKQKTLSLLIQGVAWIFSALTLSFLVYQYPIENVLSFLGL